jgi:CBS domain-containing protein
MKVKDVMTGAPRTCEPTTSAAAAAQLMLEGDCGVLPVVENGTLVGIVTDRDLYIALATQNRLASQLPVGDVARRTVLTCQPEDDVHAALMTMKQGRVRRLPVVGFGGTVLGIVSMNDLLLAAGSARGVRNDEVIDAFQAICAHHHPVPQLVTA